MKTFFFLTEEAFLRPPKSSVEVGTTETSGGVSGTGSAPSRERFQESHPPPCHVTELSEAGLNIREGTESCVFTAGVSDRAVRKAETAMREPGREVTRKSYAACPAKTAAVSLWDCQSQSPQPHIPQARLPQSARGVFNRRSQRRSAPRFCRDLHVDPCTAPLHSGHSLNQDCGIISTT